MPTINQLIRNGRKAIAAKPTAPILQKCPQKRVVDRCYDMNIPCTQVESMEKLGRACGIDVKAAAAGLLK